MQTNALAALAAKMTDRNQASVSFQDQHEVREFLRSPSTHGVDVETVEYIETHGAIVFLAGNRAYKLKRAVKFPYMDFSTLEKRAQACRHEIERNQMMAPDIYINATPVTRLEDGTLALGGSGAPVDWVVVMDRFKQTELFDYLATHDRLPLSLMPELAETISDYHHQAAVFKDIDGGELISGIASQIVTSLSKATEIVDLERIEQYANRLTIEANKHSHLLHVRSNKGLLRLCHGDLHLRNIILHNGRPTLFDAIEFDDKIAQIDVLYDLAFLLTDLWHRDLKAHANLCFGRYVSKAVETEDLDGLAALPLFLSIRASIRAMVAIDKVRVSSETDRRESLSEIESYIKLATHLLAPTQPTLIGVGGLSGTGKTTVSAGLAPQIGPAPGALHLRSDVERKHMAGIDPLERLPQKAYSKSTSDKVYLRLRDRAKQALAAGHSVIVDAVFLEARHRELIQQAADDCQVPFHGIWLEAPQATLVQRVTDRRDDASDADATVVRAQLEQKVHIAGWTRVNADGHPDDVVGRARTCMNADTRPC